VASCSSPGEERAGTDNEVFVSIDNSGGITPLVAAYSQESATTAQQLSALAAELQRASDKLRM
jgi:hypothetical protein